MNSREFWKGYFRDVRVLFHQAASIRDIFSVLLFSIVVLVLMAIVWFFIPSERWGHELQEDDFVYSQYDTVYGEEGGD